MICGKTELCIFDRPSPQGVIEYGSFEDVYPSNGITSSTSEIEFNINGSQTEYLDLNDTLLYVKIKVTDKMGKDLGEKADVTPNNFMFHSLFSDAVLALNKFKVEGGNDKFIQKSIIETVLNYNGDTKNICLSAMGYGGETYRKECISKSQPWALCGSLQLDFMDQPKYLIPGVSVQIKLKKSQSTLCLYSTNEQPSVELLEAKLMVRRVRVEPSVLAGHQLGLNKQNAIYPIRNKDIVAFGIGKDSLSFYKEQIFGDQRMPNFLLVTFQTGDQFTGTFNSSSSNFEHFNVKSMTLSKNTDYRETYTQDFLNNNYSASYMQSIVRNMGYLNKNMNCGITLDDFKSKYPFFTFVLAPDFDVNQSQLPQQGNLKLDIQFSTKLNVPAYVIIYGIFEKEIQIKANRTVLV